MGVHFVATWRIRLNRLMRPLHQITLTTCLFFVFFVHKLRPSESDTFSSGIEVHEKAKDINVCLQQGQEQDTNFGLIDQSQGKEYPHINYSKIRTVVNIVILNFKQKTFHS